MSDAERNEYLKIGRWLRPRKDQARPGSVFAKDDDVNDVLFAVHHLADAEEAMVSRGHGERYGRALIIELGDERQELTLYWDRRYQDIAKIATAPSEVRRAALARVIDELKELETKT